MQIVIDLLRHGEPMGGHVYRGQLDHPLSDLGWQQMRQAVAKNKPWQQIFSSPLSRCADFANELAVQQGIPVQYDSDLMEMAFGSWQGQSAEQLEAKDKAGFYAFYDDPIKHTPSGAEPLMVFEQRVLLAWQKLLEQSVGQHCLVVAHAGVIRMILKHILDMPMSAMYKLHVPFAGLSRIQINEEDSARSAQLIFHAGQL